MHRSPDSHKGENGKVAVIGGSKTQHGAPIFSALAAEAGGADLLYVVVPSCHADVAKHASLNFQVHAMHDDDLSTKDADMILELLATMDAAVIGPGIGRTPAIIKAMMTVIAEATCPLVLDATALQPDTIRLLQGKRAVLTPHLGELERMKIAQQASANASSILQKLLAPDNVVLLKDAVDHVISADKIEEIAGGNAGLTVGGTGDALAGLTAGLVAQGMDLFEAAKTASTVIKRAGTELFREYGYAYGTRRVIGKIPHLLSTL